MTEKAKDHRNGSKNLDKDQPESPKVSDSPPKSNYTDVLKEKLRFTYGVVGNILDQRDTALFRQIVRLRV
jgi:hypothetical protein